MSLRDTFGKDFARRAFQQVDGETRIIGKWGEIALNDDGSFDIWLVKPDRTPIGTRKLNNLVSAITSANPSREADIHVLTGEAWFATNEAALVREVAPQLGIPKRRSYSEETLQRLREQAWANLGGSA